MTDKVSGILANSRVNLSIISRTLVDHIGPITLHGKTPQLYASIEALKYRIVDLATDAILLFEHNRLLSCVVVSRSLFESVMLAHWANYQVKDYLDEKITIKELHEKLMLAVHASRSENTPLEARNILTIIKHLDKRENAERGREGLGSIEKIYGWLSGFSHANTNGAFLLYAKIDRSSLSIDLSSKMYPIETEFAIGTIDLCLRECIDSFLIFESQLEMLIENLGNGQETL